jgi:general secretion pathway protein D
VITRRITCISLLLACLLFFPCPGKTWAQAQAKPAAAKSAATGKVSLDFKDIELPDLIQTISELTGKNFIYDDSVKGKVTIISPSSMTLDEAYQVFLTVLSVKGYTIVPSGEVNKVILSREAKETNLPTMVNEAGRKPGEQYVTRIIPLQNVDANVLASTVLTPLISKNSNIVAYAPTNTLIITDNAANIDRLAEIIHELDVQSSQEALEVIPLTYASAEEAAKVATEILSQVTAVPRRGRAPINVQTAGGQAVSKVLAYTRTNSLVVMANPDDMTTIKNLVSQLDQKPSLERSNINVYYLENADAETLAKTLNEIVTGIKTQPKTPRAPQVAQAAALSNEAVSITFDKPTNALIINSTPEDYDILKGIIRQLDIKRKQVFVEALVLELSMDATKKLGVALQGAVNVGNDSLIFGTSNLNTGPAGLTSLLPAGGTDSSTTSQAPSLLSQTLEGILIGGLFNPITVNGPNGPVQVPAFSALIDISKKDADINILAAPRLLTSDNEEAEIIVGSNVPIITSRLTNAVGTATAVTSGLATSVAVERQDVALTLRFTPQITEGDRVRLNVYQEITDIAPTSVGDVNEVGPTFTKRLLRNTVLAEDGRTVVLGGLIGNNVQQTITKTPVLGDIPFLGWLFKRKETVQKKTNLLIFITPKIIKTTEDLDTVTRNSRGDMNQFKSGYMPSSLEPEKYLSPLEPRKTDEPNEPSNPAPDSGN